MHKPLTRKKRKKRKSQRATTDLPHPPMDITTKQSKNNPTYQSTSKREEVRYACC